MPSQKLVGSIGIHQTGMSEAWHARRTSNLYGLTASTFGSSAGISNLHFGYRLYKDDQGCME